MQHHIIRMLNSMNKYKQPVSVTRKDQFKYPLETRKKIVIPTTLWLRTWVIRCRLHSRKWHHSVAATYICSLQNQHAF